MHWLMFGLSFQLSFGFLRTAELPKASVDIHELVKLGSWATCTQRGGFLPGKSLHEAEAAQLSAGCRLGV